MRTCPPFEFVDRWPGSLHPIAFPEPGPELRDDCLRLLTEFGLPRKLTINCYNDITLRFSGLVTAFASIWERDLMLGYKMGTMPAEWSRFWHLADQEYVQGGGWVCIEEGSGKLVVIDGGLAEPVYLLNSSVRNFYTTLAHFLEWSQKTGGSPEETVRLRDALRRQDCIAPAELEPFWMNIIDATLDYDPKKNLVVALRPKTAARWVDSVWLAWRDCTVPQLARAAYDRRLPEGTLDPSRLILLADALEDAGCTDAELLGHLRSPGPHVRGCWAVDLVLGKR